jgi:prepilin-type processing-associated H-X9-DG protein
LIELLVVISIIALLVSILLPALGKSRQSATLTTCITRVRSIGQALHMYMADAKQFMPYGQDYRNGANPSIAQNHLNSYMGIKTSTNYLNDLNRPIQHCPIIWDEVARQGGGFSRFGLYCMNPNLMGWVGASGYDPSGTYSLFTSGFRNVNEADVINRRKSPATIITFADGFKPYQYTPSNPCTVYSPTQVVLSAPHFESRNVRDYNLPSGSAGSGGDLVAGGGLMPVAFLDGHARAHRATDFPTTGSGFDSWNIQK